eukprot:146867-Hanusia_phi.AAC.1
MNGGERSDGSEERRLIVEMILSGLASDMGNEHSVIKNIDKRTARREHASFFKQAIERSAMIPTFLATPSPASPLDFDWTMFQEAKMEGKKKEKTPQEGAYMFVFENDLSFRMKSKPESMM